MQPFQQRVVDEETELLEKIEKLATFLGGTLYRSLPIDEQTRLQEQRHHMDAYAGILHQRIQAFT